MVDITHKISTLRKAIATAILTVSRPETIEAVLNKTVPKGDVFEFARAAGLLAIKKTSDVIPDCHPLPVEYAAITSRIEGLSIVISVEVHTLYKTGVEVEAMHGAAITALTMYDMLKPLDKGVEIGTIHLASKTGGKTQHVAPQLKLKCAVVVCSDSVSSGKKMDTAGNAIVEILQKFQLSVAQFLVIPDDFNAIQQAALTLEQGVFDLVLFTGGTGLSPRDVTPEALTPLIDRMIPGIMETARAYGQQRTPYAMLSRGVAGFVKNMLVITLPGSKNGAVETMQALFPQVLHLFPVRAGAGHDEVQP